MITTIVTLLVTLPFFYVYSAIFLKWVENRKELVCLYDPLLARLPTKDTSWCIMCLSLGTLVFIGLEYTYHRVILCVWTMFFTLLARCVFLVVCPLRVHPYHIVLNDRFIEFITGHRTGQVQPYVNDLFMSGHCSWHMVVTCVFPGYQTLKHTLFGILVACLLLCKTHYTVDVLVVPFIVPPIFRFSSVFVSLLESAFI